MFSEDDLDYFARGFKIYGDMGWPMDFEAIRCVFVDAVRREQKVDWRTGKLYKVSLTYVRDFVESRPELKAYKASHIDPLRSKKATDQVRRDKCAHPLPCPERLPVARWAAGARWARGWRDFSRRARSQRAAVFHI